MSSRFPRPDRRERAGSAGSLGLRRVVTGAAAVLAAALVLPGLAAPAQADSRPRPAGAVFVQLNDLAGNEIAAYDRGRDGRLTRTGTYPTGGLGGTAPGAPVDPLASQDSLATADDGRVLLAVNAGSDTVTTFAVEGSRLRRVSVVPSGGDFPVGFAVRGSLVYVLNAGGPGAVSGFRLRGAKLVPIAGSTRELGLANTSPPSFITAPAQAGITPDGRTLLVTTKANGTILGLPLGRDGSPTAAAPVSSPSAGPVPFSFVVGPHRTLHVTQAGDGRITSYDVLADGSVRARGSSAPTGGRALCWVVRVGDVAFGANTGSGTLSAFSLRGGTATLLRPVAADTGGAPIDLAASRDGRFLYAQNPGLGTLTVHKIGAAGELTDVQTVTGLPVASATGDGMEGVVAL